MDSHADFSILKNQIRNIFEILGKLGVYKYKHFLDFRQMLDTKGQYFKHWDSFETLDKQF